MEGDVVLFEVGVGKHSILVRLECRVPVVGERAEAVDEARAVGAVKQAFHFLATRHITHAAMLIQDAGSRGCRTGVPPPGATRSNAWAWGREGGQSGQF